MTTAHTNSKQSTISITMATKMAYIQINESYFKHTIDANQLQIIQKQIANTDL